MKMTQTTKPCPISPGRIPPILRRYRCVRCVALAAILVTAGCGEHTNDRPQPKTTATAEVQSSNPRSASVDREPTAETKPAVEYSGDAFRMAAHDGKIDVVRKAIAAGTEVDSRDPARNYTALLMAAYNGHTSIVKLLLKEGAEVDARDSEGKTPLMHASSGPFAETVAVLIDAGANVNATETTEGFTALMTAAAVGEVDVVKLLLQRGADPSIVDEDNDTAKNHAVTAGKPETAALLP